MNDKNNDCFLDMELDEIIENYFPGGRVHECASTRALAIPRSVKLQPWT